MQMADYTLFITSPITLTSSLYSGSFIITLGIKMDKVFKLILEILK